MLLGEEGSTLGADVGAPTFLNRGDPAGGWSLGFVTRRGDMLFDSDGAALREGDYDFVLQGGELKVGNGHYFLSDGEPVEFAGSMRVVAGRLVQWDNASGHFRPASELATNAGLPLYLFRAARFPAMVGNPELPVFRNVEEMR